MFAIFANSALAQSAPPGTQISNVANVAFEVPGAVRNVASNTVQLTVQPAPTRGVVEILRFASGANNTSTAGPSICRAGGVDTPLAPPQVAGAGAINPLAPVPLGTAPTVHAGDAVFVRVIDGDRNLDGLVLDTIEVQIRARSNGDIETIRLTETGPNTGIFVGYLPTRVLAGPVAPNCALDVARDTLIDALYTDPADATDASQASSLVDPFGRIFDSSSGQPVNGTRVRLVDAATGAAATVFGDDGVSRYPAEMITGTSVTDSGGTNYIFPAGFYRFPLVAPGNYRLVIEPPLGYAAPSLVSEATLQTLPGAPYRLQPGSFGADFAVIAPPGVGVDVPLDPEGDSLALVKAANVTTAAVGDLIEYRLELSNTSVRGPIRQVVVTDRLPLGLRLRADTVRVDGAIANEPRTSADGNDLLFDVAIIPVGGRISIRYVAEVVPSARGEQLVNTALARSRGGVLSNNAVARVSLQRDFFDDKGFIVGRVLRGGCDALTAGGEGLANVRVYLESGRYVLTDPSGRYHFEGLDPGTHVVQVDTITVPKSQQLVHCEHNNRHAGRDYSQFVELRGGELERVDFAVVDRAPPLGDLQWSLRSEPQDNGDVIHIATIVARDVPVRNLRLLVQMPASLRAVRSDVKSENGVWTIAAGELQPGRQRREQWRSVRTGLEGTMAELKAVLLFDTAGKSAQSSAPLVNRIALPALQREVEDRKLLRFNLTPRFAVLGTELQAADISALEGMVTGAGHRRVLFARVTGHADNTPIAPRSRHLFADNAALSRARAQSVADWLAARLKLTPEQIDVIAKGDAAPENAGRDAQSRARNRRVEIELELESRETRSELAGGSAEGAEQRRADQQLQIVGSWGETPQTVTPTVTRATLTEGADSAIDLTQLKPEFAWLTPKIDAIPAIASIKIALVHPFDTRIELTLDGARVSELNFDGVESNEAKTVSLSRWRGVDLRDGNNNLRAVLRNAAGEQIGVLERVVHYSGGAIRAEHDKTRSQLSADGQQRPVIALRLFDAFGKPARPGTLVEFAIDAPYRSWLEVERLNDNPLLTIGSKQLQSEVDNDGLARIELEPTTQAGFVTLRLRFSERRSQDLRVWLEPAAREFIMVGVASGTLTHRKLSANIERSPAALAAFAEEDLEAGSDTDGRIAFFAKGRVRGDFLLTLAYDSERDSRAARERLKGIIEPDKYYLLYGDGTEARDEAASTEKLFLKLERRQFVALFGDYDSGFTLTELSRYSRSLTGLKADYGGENLGVSAFAARTDLGAVRDEIPGDGTSGQYRLSRAPLVVASDKLRIEVRDRFNPERRVSVRELSRFIDYRIDYALGTLFFKEPIPSRDADFNPVLIVAEYETPGTGAEATVAGLRVDLHNAAATRSIAATALQDGDLNGDTQLYALDARWQLTPETELRAEVGTSRSDDPLRPASADAWLAELKHVSEQLELRAYARSEDEGYGVGQQYSGDSGSQKLGLDARWQMSRAWMLQGQTFWQDSLTSEARRQMTRAELRYQDNGRTLGLGVTHADDEEPGGASRRSDLLTASGSIDLFERRVTLRGSLDSALSDRDASVDYPARTVLGLDYHLPRGTRLFAEWEHAEGARLESDMTRIGVRSQPFERTQVQSSLTQVASDFGPRVYSNFGLSQGWQLNERWTLDLGLDQSNTLRGAGLVPQDADVPLASGSLSEDFLSVFTGAHYRRDDWSLAARVERRSADSEKRWVMSTGWYREERNGHALSLALLTQTTDALSADDTDNADLRFAWAYRPDSQRWIVLNRVDLRRDARSGLLSEFETYRLVNNLHANWQWNAQTQIGLQLGLKLQRSSFETDTLSSTVGLLGVDLRRNLNRRFDVGLHLAEQRSFSSDVAARLVGADIGMTLARNVWISLGYNFRGTDDGDFAAGKFNDRGPYLQLRIKADQDTFKDLRLDALRAPRRAGDSSNAHAQADRPLQ